MPRIYKSDADYHYHVLHRPDFDKLAAWSSAKVKVLNLAGTGFDNPTMYSLQKDMDQLRADGAKLGIVDAGVKDVGNSAEGKKLWALKVGNGSHKVLFTGCHHAREWISVEIPYLVAEYLVTNYRPNPDPTDEKAKRIKHLLMNRQIWFVPMLNPDGHEYTTLTDRNWRTNLGKHYVDPGTIARAPANGGPVSYPGGTYIGVDINRNYAYKWGQETFSGTIVRTSRNPMDCGELGWGIWCGVGPSGTSKGEPESNAIHRLNLNGFRAGITYHSYSQFLLYPDAADPDPVTGRASDTFVRDWVGHGLRDLIALYGNTYEYKPGSANYPLTGGLRDFQYEQARGRPSSTVELRPDPGGAGAFSALPESEIGPCFRENLPAALALINCAGHDTAAGSRRCSVVTASPPSKCQVVRHAWQVFRVGWTP